ncbi:MAG: hypothetical protein WD397_08000 [Wenzhouxiangellaceae bacterium]
MKEVRFRSSLHICREQGIQVVINRCALLAQFNPGDLMHSQIVAVQVVAREIGRRPAKGFGLEVKNIRADLQIAGGGEGQVV